MTPEEHIGMALGRKLWSPKIDNRAGDAIIRTRLPQATPMQTVIAVLELRNRPGEIITFPTR